MINREQIAVALFTQLQQAVGITTFSRELRHFNDVQPEEMPYVCLVGGPQRVEQARHTPPQYTLHYELYLYVGRQGSDAVAATLLNNALDAIDQALEPKTRAFPEQTLGLGIVRHCRVSGDIVTDEGTLGDCAVAVVPIEIVALG